MNVIGCRYCENNMSYFKLDFQREFKTLESMLKIPIIDNENQEKYLYLAPDTFETILYDCREYNMIKREDYEVLKEIMSTLFAIESLK